MNTKADDGQAQNKLSPFPIAKQENDFRETSRSASRSASHNASHNASRSASHNASQVDVLVTKFLSKVIAEKMEHGCLILAERNNYLFNNYYYTCQIIDAEEIGQ